MSRATRLWEGAREGQRQRVGSFCFLLSSLSLLSLFFFLLSEALEAERKSTSDHPPAELRLFLDVKVALHRRVIEALRTLGLRGKQVNTQSSPQ